MKKINFQNTFSQVVNFIQHFFKRTEPEKNLPTYTSKQVCWFQGCFQFRQIWSMISQSDVENRILEIELPKCAELLMHNGL